MVLTFGGARLGNNSMGTAVALWGVGVHGRWTSDSSHGRCSAARRVHGGGRLACLGEAPTLHSEGKQGGGAM